MHLHYHLKDCILDFGPVYSFWLFSFERLNGVLGSYRTNCKDISLQLMRRFSMSSHYVCVDSWPAEYRDEFYPMLARHATSFQQASQIASRELSAVHPSPPVIETAWESHEREALQGLIKSIAGSPCSPLTLYLKTYALTINNFI